VTLFRGVSTPMSLVTVRVWAMVILSAIVVESKSVAVASFTAVIGAQSRARAFASA
jgi:hypothetical protein